MKFLYITAFSIIIIFSQQSCKKAPDGGIPFYLQIDTVKYTSNPTYNGADGIYTGGISNIWVQTSSTNLGAYQMPCSVPVLQDSSVSFLVSAGVYQDGMFESPTIYPFYKADTFTIVALPGKKYAYTPTFSYKSGLVFPFGLPENFDGTSGNEYDSMTICTNPAIVKYGQRCGQITVSSTDSSVIANESRQPYALPTSNEVWLEFDYMAQVPFWVGINGYYASNGTVAPTQVLFVVQQPNWTKMYVSLTQTVQQLNASSYLLFFQALNPSGNAGGSVYLDNIKVVYQQ